MAAYKFYNKVTIENNGGELMEDRVLLQLHLTAGWNYCQDIANKII